MIITIMYFFSSYLKNTKMSIPIVVVYDCHSTMAHLDHLRTGVVVVDVDVGRITVYDLLLLLLVIEVPHPNSAITASKADEHLIAGYDLTDPELRGLQFTLHLPTLPVHQHHPVTCTTIGNLPVPHHRQAQHRPLRLDLPQVLGSPDSPPPRLIVHLPHPQRTVP